MASTSGVHLSAKTDAPSTGAEGSGLGAGVPSLRRLCMQLIGDARVDVDNVLAALELGTAHGIPALRNRAERFVRSTWKGVRAQHSEEALQEALGRDVFAALEREQADLDAAVRKLKITGTVVDGPARDIAGPVQMQPDASVQAQAVRNADSKRVAPQSTGGRFRFGGGGEKCTRCAKTAYPAERVAVNDRIFHQACFRCCTQTRKHARCRRQPCYCVDTCTCIPRLGDVR